MSITRRKFVKAGVLAAAVAALPVRTILAQSFKERDGNPTEAPPQQSDSLSNYSKATFLALINSVFQLHTSTGIVEVTLASVDDLPATKGGECFALLFRGGSRPQPQETYTFVHGSLGTFNLLLVPGGADQNGAQSYVATLNRISLLDLNNMTAPTRGNSARPSNPGNTNTTNTPTAPANTAPANTSAPSTGTAPAVITQPTQSAPVLKRKQRHKAPDSQLDNLNLIR